jgi:hypothetical protein
MAACFGFWREISRMAFWDFCNTIGTNLPRRLATGVSGF